MANKIWRWIKKAFLFNIISFFLMWVVFILFGITLATLTSWIRLNPLLALLTFVVANLIVDGFLIEWVNKNKWANK